MKITFNQFFLLKKIAENVGVLVSIYNVHIFKNKNTTRISEIESSSTQLMETTKILLPQVEQSITWICKEP